MFHYLRHSLLCGGTFEIQRFILLLVVLVEMNICLLKLLESYWHFSKPKIAFISQKCLFKISKSSKSESVVQVWNLFRSHCTCWSVWSCLRIQYCHSHIYVCVLWVGMKIGNFNAMSTDSTEFCYYYCCCCSLVHWFGRTQTNYWFIIIVSE